jgi:hypothetical protein
VGSLTLMQHLKSQITSIFRWRSIFVQRTLGLPQHDVTVCQVLGVPHSSVRLKAPGLYEREIKNLGQNGISPRNAPQHRLPSFAMCLCWGAWGQTDDKSHHASFVRGRGGSQRGGGRPWRHRQGSRDAMSQKEEGSCAVSWFGAMVGAQLR